MSVYVVRVHVCVCACVCVCMKYGTLLTSYTNMPLCGDMDGNRSHALCALHVATTGSPPGKVYGKLHTVAARINERY